MGLPSLNVVRQRGGKLGSPGSGLQSAKPGQKNGLLENAGLVPVNAPSNTLCVAQSDAEGASLRITQLMDTFRPANASSAAAAIVARPFALDIPCAPTGRLSSWSKRGNRAAVCAREASMRTTAVLVMNGARAGGVMSATRVPFQ